MRIPGAVKVELLGILGLSLYGKTIGIIGMGRIGQALARRALSSGVAKVTYHNRRRSEPAIENLYNATFLSLDELLMRSDIVSVCAPFQ